MVDFTDDEKEYLKKLVQNHLEKFQDEEKDIISDMRPGFLKGEKEYEMFIKKILEKLK